MSIVGEAFEDFVRIVAALRHPKTGCPWDQEQTHASLKKYLLEESCEAMDAIDACDDGELEDELGDVLLQVVLHSQIASERDAFDVRGVIDRVAKKMIRRHPHVFGNTVVKDADEVLSNWDQIKVQEAAERGASRSASRLSKIPRSLPALMRADRIGKFASEVGFDWIEPAQVWAKVEEELAELKAEVGRDDRMVELRQELGDLLFSLAQYARHIGIDPELALRETNDRFSQRFFHIEETLGEGFESSSLDQKESLWKEAKQIEKS